MNLRRMRTVLLPCTTGKKIIKPDTSIPGKQWNMPIKRSGCRKKPIGNLRNQRGSHKDAWTGRRS
jgi:hypothetical protein